MIFNQLLLSHVDSKELILELKKVILIIIRCFCVFWCGTWFKADVFKTFHNAITVKNCFQIFASLHRQIEQVIFQQVSSITVIINTIYLDSYKYNKNDYKIHNENC